MGEPMLVCVDPDAIDTHRSRWLEIDMWLEGFSLRDAESVSAITVPDGFATADVACEQAAA
jgi:hypothetical protein